MRTDDQMTEATPPPAVSKRVSRLPYRDRSSFLVLLTATLYFGQGLPLGFTFAAYPVLLRTSGEPLSLIAWVPLLGLPWMLKFFWSPAVDNRWSARFGRRRSWLLSQQALMIAVMAAVALIPPGVATITHFILLGLASLFGATQDIATDGLAAERLTHGALSNANALAIAGMATGFLAGGGGVLMLTGVAGYTVAMSAVIAALIVCVVPVLMWQEGSVQRVAPATLGGALRRRGSLLLLALAILYGAPHSIDAALSRLFLVDQGWSLTELGTLDTAAMAAMAAIGCGTAAWLMPRIGAWPCAMLGLAVSCLAALYWLSASAGMVSATTELSIAARVVGASGMGLTSAAAFTAFMLFARGASQAGTDVTLFKSANAFGELGSASAGTAIAAAAGFAAGFGIAAVSATAAICLAFLMKQSQSQQASSQRATMEVPQ